MKIFITGSKGQLASEFSRLTTLRGDEVRGVDLDTLDIADFQAVCGAINSFNPDLILNCAAYNDVDRAETDWEGAFLANGIGVRNLAIAARQNNALFVHYSTDYVFDGRADRPYTIADVPNPISSYGQSKLLGEEMLRQHGGDYFLIRTSWLFGHGTFSFPKKIIEWSRKNDSLRIVNDQVASPTFTSDLAGATLRLIERGSFGLYHITNSGSCSRYDWAKFILGSIGWQGTLEPARSSDFQTPAQRPEFSVLDNFPLTQTIGAPMPAWQDATTRFLSELASS